MPTFRLKTPTEIGALIRARRTALGLSQDKLAAKVGVSRLWINQVERGKHGAGIGLVLRTLTAVGASLNWTEPAANPGKDSARPSFDINSIIENAKRKTS